MNPQRRRVAVVGAGWAGLAAAVQATTDGHAVTLYEMASHGGGRARSVRLPNTELDNGQHILIGAYTETLRLMRLVGVEPPRVLDRRPLELIYPDGSGLRMRRGPASLAFAWAVLRARGWSWRERWSLLRLALQWQRRGMRNPGVATVDELCQPLAARVRADLIDPLCIAALNTPASQASATVFLQVLADAVFGASGSSDQLLPRAGLSRLFPQPAIDWLGARGVERCFGRRVHSLERRGEGGWFVDGAPFDVVVLACSAVEAARLAAPWNPTWSQHATALRYEPIATVYLRRGAAALPRPMVALRSARDAPAQFAIDLGLLGHHPDVVAFVVSGAGEWIERGLDALSASIQRQATLALPASFGANATPALHSAMERRATFACTPDLVRPKMEVAAGLLAAGDYVEGPYPATLEGAVRSALRAVRALGAAAVA